MQNIIIHFYILLQLFTIAICNNIIACNKDELIVLAKQINRKCLYSMSQRFNDIDDCGLRQEWTNCMGDLKSKCFDYELANNTFGFQQEPDNCPYFGEVFSIYCTPEELQSKQDIYNKCFIDFVKTEREFWRRFDLWYQISEFEKKYFICKLKESNVWGSNSSCSQVFQGCSFDAYFQHPMTLQEFAMRRNKMKAIIKYFPDDVSENGYCDEVFDIVHHNFNVHFFRKFWPLRDNCTIGDSFQIQVDIEKKCFNLSNVIFQENDNASEKCMKMNDIIDCISRQVYKCYNPETMVNLRLYPQLDQKMLTFYNRNRNPDIKVNILARIVLPFLLKNVLEITQYEVPPKEFISNCPIFKKVQFEDWFRINDCNASQSLEEVVKNRNLEIQLEQFLIFVKLLRRTDTYLKLWLDETDALCSFYYASTNIIETSKSVCGEVSGINEPIDKYEIRNPAVTLGEMLGFYKYARYDSFNADGFCKAHATKNEIGFKFVDLSLERKENCSVYDIWKLENVIIDECYFDENLDLCSAMQGMLSCHTQYLEDCFEPDEINLLNLQLAFNLFKKMKENISKVLKCGFFKESNHNISLTWPFLIPIMEKVQLGEKCEMESLQYIQEYEKARKTRNLSEMENIACKYLDHYYYQNGGCWGHMDICLENIYFPDEYRNNPLFDCPKLIGLIRGFKLRTMMKQEVPNAFKKCFHYDFKLLP